MTKKNLKLEFYKEANEDIENIESYIIENYYDYNVAHRIITKIYSSIYSIYQFPNSYPLVSNKKLSKIGIRKIRCGNYIVYFKNCKKEIYIIGIFNSKMSISKICKEIVERITRN